MPSNAYREMWSAARKAPDTVLAVGLAVGVLVAEVVAGTMDWANWTVPVVVVTSAIAVAVRRRWPIPAVAVYCATLALASVLGNPTR